MSNNRILIVRLSALGDVIHTLPLVCALKKENPNLFIGWVVEDKASALLENNPIIDKLYVMPKKKWKKNKIDFLGNLKEFFSIIKEIRNDNYDVAIDVQGLLKSAVVSFLSGAKRRLTHSKTREFAYIFGNERLDTGREFGSGEHIIERNLHFARHLGCKNPSVHYSIPSCSDEDRAYVELLLKDCDKSKKTVVFAPATTWINKHWPNEHWAELLKEFAPRCNVVFSGMKSDLPLIEEIITLSGNSECIVLAGKTDILSLCELFRRSDVVVSVDSGSAHLACALEHPQVICILGPTDEKRNGPFGAEHFSVVSNVFCRPCFKKKCSGNIECMKELYTQKVSELINKLLTNEVK